MLDENLLFNLNAYNKERYFCNNNDIPMESNIEYERILKARYNKCSRIKQHVIWLIHRRKNIYFVTFTFSDKYIDKCDRTKKDLIKKCLNDFDSDIYYIVNVDYGKKNERQHYHALVGTHSNLDFDLFLKFSYPCFTKCEKVRFDSTSLSNLPKYINKLSNHATKSTTRNSRVLYNFKGYGNVAIPEVKKEYILDKECVGLT